MSLTLPPGRSGTFVKQIAEMVPAPREGLVLPAFLALASALLSRRFKDGHGPTNLFLLSAAPDLAGKTRMLQALTRAVHSAQVGWDADESGRDLVATHGIAGRMVMTESPWRSASRIHAEMLRAGSACFLADDFKPTGSAVGDDSDLRAYLSAAWDAGTGWSSLSQFDRRVADPGGGSGAMCVWNPSLTIWATCTPLALPRSTSDFWSRWLVVRDAAPNNPPMRQASECRPAFSTELADVLRQWIVDARALDDAYAAAAIKNDAGPDVSSPQALADVQRAELVSLEWDGQAQVALGGVKGRQIALARRVACLIAAANGDRVVDEDVAEWAVATARRWAALGVTAYRNLSAAEIMAAARAQKPG